MTLCTPAIIKAPIRIGVYPYESPCDGINSDSEAFNRAINDITAGGGAPHTWRIEIGTKLVLTEPTPPLDRHMIIGEGALASTIIKRFAGGVLFNFNGRYGYSGGGILGLSVPLTDCTSGSYTILGRARADGYAPDRLRLEDLYLGSGALIEQTPFRHIELHGAARLSPLGIREPVLKDVTCFGSSSSFPILFDTLVAADCENTAVFPAPYNTTNYGGVLIQNCIESSFARCNFDGPVVKNNNLGCSVTDKGNNPI